MAAVEFSTSSSTCRRCGQSYGRLKGNFPVSYAPLYKGTGYLPYCRTCVDDIYNLYLSQCKDPADAVRQTCRKLDIYWSQSAFDALSNNTSTRSIMTMYLQKLSMGKHISKCYDDTLLEEKVLWLFPEHYREMARSSAGIAMAKEEAKEEAEKNPQAKALADIEQGVIDFWGPGYTAEMYCELEDRRQYWVRKLQDAGYEIDVGTEALLRQICNLEIDINKDRASGRDTDKKVSALNSIIGSMNLKPAQKKDDKAADSDFDSTPFGVWIKRFEDERPIPEADPEMEDVDGIKKFLLTWVYGHLAKMLNIKNAHSKLYDEAIAKYRVERPEFNDDDDDDMLYNILSDKEDT